jgi:hypothetical protein
MIARMLARTVIVGVVATVAWNTGPGTSMRDWVQDTTTNFASAQKNISGILPGNAQGKTQAASLPVISCKVTLVLPSTPAKDGLFTDLKAAARDMNQITGMNITTAKEGEPVQGEQIGVILGDSSKMSTVAPEKDTYALIATSPTDGARNLYINSDRIYELRRGTGVGTRYNVLLHELGHVAGVSHLDDEDALMSVYPSLVAGVTNTDVKYLQESTQRCR